MEFEDNFHRFMFLGFNRLKPSWYTHISHMDADLPALARYLIDKANKDPLFAHRLENFCPKDDHDSDTYYNSEQAYFQKLYNQMWGLDLYYYRRSPTAFASLGDNPQREPMLPWCYPSVGIYSAGARAESTGTPRTKPRSLGHRGTGKTVSGATQPSQTIQTPPAGSQRPQEGKLYGGTLTSDGGVDSTRSKVYKDPESAHKDNEGWRKPNVIDGTVEPLEGTSGKPKKIPMPHEKGQVVERTYNGKTYRITKNDEGFPDFTIYESYLDDSNINNKDDSAHFEEANRRLGQQLKNKPTLATELGLNERQVKFLTADPPKKKSPPSLTWHHHEDVGKMQLVDESLHARFQHVGGMEIWGGARK